MRPALLSLALALAVASGLLASGVLPRRTFGFLPQFGPPMRLTTLHVGEFADVPPPFAGRCLHVVAFHGSCRGCEDVTEGRGDAYWVTEERHPRDTLFPRVFYSPPLWEALGVQAIPSEYMVRASGRVAYIGSPLTGRPPTCEQMGERGG